MTAADSFVTLLREEFRAVVREELRTHRPAATNEQELLTLDGAEKLTKISKQTLRRMLRKGELARYGEGRMVRINAAELLARLSVKATPTEADDDDAFARKLLAKKGRE